MALLAHSSLQGWGVLDGALGLVGWALGVMS